MRITSTRNSAAPVKVFDTTYCYAKYVSGQSCSTDKDKDTGLRQWQKDEIAGKVSEYSHDKSNRLTKATNFNGKTYDYDYDTNGNRKSVKVDGTTTQTLAYNSANQVTTTNNVYENRGNQTKVSTPVIGTLSYNAANQMTSAYGPGGQANYTYAGTDQVELTQAGAIKLDYGRDDQYGMAWLQSWTNDTATTAYVERDGLGTPLGLRIGTTDYAYVLDGLGSVVAIVSSNNTVAATYQYDPYGTATATSESGLGQPNLIGYAGGIYDKATTLTRFGQRWFNPNQGRFTQQDSLSFIGDPARGNRYAYAVDNPINYTDPTGMYDWNAMVNTWAKDTVMGLVGGCLATLFEGCAGGAAAGGVGGFVTGAIDGINEGFED